MRRYFGIRQLAIVILACMLPVATAWSQDFELVRNTQIMLIWTGDHDGFADGKMGPMTRASIQRFQANHGFKRTGELTGDEFKLLGADAERAITAAGFEIQQDARTGVAIGIPTALVHESGETKWGSGWSSASSAIYINTFNLSRDFELNDLYQQLSTKTGRKVTYSHRADREFILSATDADGTEVYIRMIDGDNAIRGYLIDYEQDVGARLKPIIVAMASSFEPFPAVPAATGVAAAPEPAAPPQASVAATTTVAAPDSSTAAPPATPAAVTTSLKGCLNGLGDCPKAFAK